MQSRAVLVVAVLAVLSVQAHAGGGGPEPVVPADSKVIVLTKDTFAQTQKGNWFVEFYAPWCGHCKALAPTWETLAKTVEGANIAKVDCTVEKEIQAQIGVRGFPTLKLFKNGEMIDYRGGRDVPSFVSFLESQGALVQVDPQVELRYFETRGRAEVIRLVLEELGIKYNDTRYTWDQWLAVKPNADLFPFHQMPSLSFDGVNLVQTSAILRWLARKYKINGRNDAETTNVDIALGGLEDLYIRYTRLTYDKEFSSKKEDYLTNVLPTWLSHFEALLIKLGGESLSGARGGVVSVADIVAIELFTLQVELAGADLLKPYPTLAAYVQRLVSRPNIKAYFLSERRPKFAHGNSAFFNNEANPPHKLPFFEPTGADKTEL